MANTKQPMDPETMIPCRMASWRALRSSVNTNQFL
jgi:hypothetical protein